MISNCRQFMYRCDPTGRIESRIFEQGEEIQNGWFDSPKAAKAKPYSLITRRMFDTAEIEGYQ